MKKTVRKKGIILVTALVYAMLLQTAVSAQTLDFWHTFTQGARQENLAKNAEEFEAAHPGVKVRVTPIGWGMMMQKWIVALEAGNLPDILTGLSSHIVTMYQAGATQPVDDVVEELGGPEFFRGLTEKIKWEGQILGLPLYTHAYLYWYRKDLLQKYGLGVPKTWDEFLNVATKLTDPPQRYGMIIPLAKTSAYSAQILYQLMRTNDASAFDKNGNVVFNSPETIETVKYYMKIYKLASPEKTFGVDIGEVLAAFWQGRNGFLNWAPFAISSGDQSCTWGMENLGAMVPPQAKELPGFLSSYVSLAMSKTTKNRELAKEFLKFTYEKDRYIRWLHSVPGGMLPATREAAEAPEYWSNDLIRTHMDAVRLAIEGTKLGTPEWMSYGLQPYAGIVRDSKVVNDMLQDIALGNKTVEEAVAETHKRIEEMVAELI